MLIVETKMTNGYFGCNIFFLFCPSIHDLSTVYIKNTRTQQREERIVTHEATKIACIAHLLIGLTTAKTSQKI